jgi:hypothetical protein
VNSARKREGFDLALSVTTSYQRPKEVSQQTITFNGYARIVQTRKPSRKARGRVNATTHRGRGG